MATENAEDSEMLIAIRQRAAHDLMSPARGVSIVADLLAEALEQANLDVDLIRALSRQLSMSTDDLLARLGSFAEGS